jgi:predicted acylesterase/phospholipase RssA
MTGHAAADVKTKFTELATETFKHRREGAVLTVIDRLQVASKTLLLLGFFQSVYPTSPLKRGLVKLFGENLKLFSSAMVQKEQRSTRVAVTSTKDTAAQRCLIANYNRPGSKSNGNIEPEDDFEREDEDEKEMKVWEAALATASAPFYFRPFEKAETLKNYIDGVLHANLPIEYALEEMDNLWAKADGDVTLDALISVGTGIQKKELDIPKILEIGGFKPIFTSFHNNINSQRLWEAFINKPTIPPEVRGRVHRLNAYIKGDYVRIDDYKKMGIIEETVAQQMEESADMPSPLSRDIARAADILTASLFFFEPNPPNYGDKDFGMPTSGGRHELKGSIRCRLARDSQELKRLVDIIEGFWHREVLKSALYRPREDEDEPMLSAEKSSLERSRWTPIELAGGWKNDVRTGGAWFRVDCTILTYDPTEAQQIIGVTLTPPREERQRYVFDPVPISGFPISLKRLRSKAGWA